MPKYRVYGVITGTKYLGEFEAGTPEEAEQMGLESDSNRVSICHHCSGEFDLDDSGAHSAIVELVEDDK